MDLKEYLDSNYLRALRAQTEKLKKGAAYDVFVFHDEWCGIYRGVRCNCDVKVVTKERSAPEGAE